MMPLQNIDKDRTSLRQSLDAHRLIDRTVLGIAEVFSKKLILVMDGNNKTHILWLHLLIAAERS
jgi:hypothetical protein